MATLASILSDVTAKIAEELKSEGGAHLALQLATCEIEQCSYDPSAKAGFITFARVVNPQFLSPQFDRGRAPLLETWAFASININVHVDMDEKLMSIEFIARQDVVDELQRARLLLP